MKKPFLLFALLCSLPALRGCRPDNYATFHGYQQGTTYTLTVKNPPHDLSERIDEVFERVDLTFSMFNPASLTSRINRGETDAVSPLFEECFALAKRVHALSGGYFDPTVKPLVDAWGFGPQQMQQVPDTASIIEYVGFKKIRIERGRIIKDDVRVQLDFSSIAKGFTVDLLARMLDDEGVGDYMVEVGGEVRVKGKSAASRPWRIGIDKPAAGLGRKLETVVELGDGGRIASVATSGNYRNWFVDEAGAVRVHTINPKTGLSSHGELLSVSIAAPECALADAWATGIMACGEIETARRLLSKATGIEYYIIYGLDAASREIGATRAAGETGEPGTAGETGATASFHSPGFPSKK